MSLCKGVYEISIAVGGGKSQRDDRTVWGRKGREMERIDIEEALREGKSIQIRPQGYSMYPLLVPGRDEVILRAADPAELRRGDVVLYRREGSILVLHRIWKKRSDGFYMVGDNQTKVEGPIAAEQVRAIMTGIIRKGRYLPAGNPGYRFLAAVWLLLRPFRRAISLPIAKLRALLRRPR